MSLMVKSLVTRGEPEEKVAPARLDGRSTIHRYVAYGIVQQNISGDTEPYESNLAYLHQGAKFNHIGRYGDTSVDHQKVDGLIAPTPVVDGSLACDTPEFSSGDTYYWYSRPPCKSWILSESSGQNMYYLDVCPFELVKNVHSAQGNFRVFVFYGDWFYLEPAHWKVAYSLTIQADGKLNGSSTAKLPKITAYADGTALKCDGARRQLSYSRTIDKNRLIGVSGIDNIINVCRGFMRELKAEFLSRVTTTYGSPSSVSPYSGSRYLPIEDFSSGKQVDRILENYATLADSQITWNADDLSHIAKDLVEKYNNFSSNLLAYAGDLKKTGDSIRSILALAGDIKNPKKWASAWLSGRYGDTLMISDTKELLESTSKALALRRDRTLARTRMTKAHRNAVGSFQSIRCATVWAYNDSYNALMTGIDTLMRWDAWPTLENMWDLVPLSFVVDWFIPVQKILDQIDATVQAPYIRQESAYVTIKNIADFCLSPTEIVGNIRITRFQRFPYDSLKDIRPFSVDMDPPSFSVIHGVDALALLVQTSKGHR